uniref:Apple domain-containing protein n=1 Tax=Pyrodinium bahamense TaxID=73915 RepID=A0A7S0FJ25_9DINO
MAAMPGPEPRLSPRQRHGYSQILEAETASSLLPTPAACSSASSLKGSFRLSGHRGLRIAAGFCMLGAFATLCATVLVLEAARSTGGDGPLPKSIPPASLQPQVKAQNMNLQYLAKESSVVRQGGTTPPLQADPAPVSSSATGNGESLEAMKARPSALHDSAPGTTPPPGNAAAAAGQPPAAGAPAGLPLPAANTGPSIIADGQAAAAGGQQASDRDGATGTASGTSAGALPPPPAPAAPVVRAAPVIPPAASPVPPGTALSSGGARGAVREVEGVAASVARGAASAAHSAANAVLHPLQKMLPRAKTSAAAGVPGAAGQAPPAPPGGAVAMPGAAPGAAAVAPVAGAAALGTVGIADGAANATLGALVTSTLPPAKCGQIDVGVDYPGNDLGPASDSSSPEACCQKCANNGKCVAWTWVRAINVCFLKGRHPRRTLTKITNAETISGMPTQVQRGIPVITRKPGQSLLCWTLMLPWGYEKGMIAMQYHKGVSIFRCDEYVVYSNQSIQVATGVTTSVVDSDLTCEMGGEFKTALNTQIFLQVWKRIFKDDRARFHDWTVKVDADAVFFADRLREVVAQHPEEPRGVYLNNCRMGMHGPLEVFSRNAVAAWRAARGRCISHFQKLCKGNCKWGEDMFIDQCLWKVQQVRRDFESRLLLEDHCAPPPGWWQCRNASVVSFHPFKDPAKYEQCMANSIEAAR